MTPEPEPIAEIPIDRLGLPVRPAADPDTVGTVTLFACRDARVAADPTTPSPEDAA